MTDVIKRHVCTEEELVGKQLVCLLQTEKQLANLNQYLECNCRKKRSYTSQDYTKDYHVNQLVLSRFH